MEILLLWQTRLLCDRSGLVRLLYLLAIVAIDAVDTIVILMLSTAATTATTATIATTASFSLSTRFLKEPNYFIPNKKKQVIMACFFYAIYIVIKLLI